MGAVHFNGIVHIRGKAPHRATVCRNEEVRMLLRRTRKPVEQWAHEAFYRIAKVIGLQGQAWVTNGSARGMRTLGACA